MDSMESNMAWEWDKAWRTMAKNPINRRKGIHIFRRDLFTDLKRVKV